MAKFCECCGQPMPGTESVSLFTNRLNIEVGIMRWPGGSTRLTIGESYICMALARNHPRPVSMNFLMDYMENTPMDFRAEGPRIVDVYISHIRAKMLKADCPFHIETIWGIGKHFAEGPADGRIMTASGYSREHWKAKHRGE